MKNNKTLLLILVLFIVNSCVLAQAIQPGPVVQLEPCDNCLMSNYLYHPAVSMGTRNIISDFGPRSSASYWHGGIDYTVEGPDDQGYHVLSAESGVIRRVRATAGQKYLEIVGQSHLMYTHLFTSLIVPSSGGIRQGDLALVELTVHPPGGAYQYGVLHYGISDTTLIARCRQSNCSDSYVILGSDTIIATDQISDGDIIGSLGTSHKSSVTASVASHLHVQRFKEQLALNLHYKKDNLLNPLEIINHQGPSYEVIIDNESTSSSHTFSGTRIIYSGNAPSHIRVTPYMPDSINGVVNNGFGSNYIFDNNTLNIDRVSLNYLDRDDSLKLLRGSTYDAKIWMGSVFDRDIEYPNGANASDGTALSDVHTQDGSRNRQAIYPKAYGSRSCRCDEYYFSDIISRLHKNDPKNGGNQIELASTPDESLLLEGTNKLIAIVEDVRGNLHESDTIEFVLDNFKPYVKSISASINGREMYDFHWESVGGKLEPRGGIVPSSIPFSINDLNGEMIVEVEASESLDTLSLDLLRPQDENCPESTDTILHSMTMMSINRKNWTFTFDYVADCGIGEGVVDVTGADWRFRFSGQDFGPDGNPGSQLLDFSGAYDVIVDRAQNTMPQLALDYRVSTTAGSEWSGTQDSRLASGVDDTHYFRFTCSGPGNFRDPNDRDIAVENKFMEDEFLRFICCEDELNIVLDSQFQPFDNENCGPVGSCEMALVVAIEGQEGVGLGEPPTFAWSNGDTGQNISGLCSGTYTVTATTERGCTAEASFELCCLDLEVLDIQAAGEDGESGSFRLQVNTDTDIVLATINGSPFNYEQDVTGLSSGTYQIELRISGNCRLIRPITIPDCENETINLEVGGGEFSRCNGEIDLTINDGINYTYTWSDGYSEPRRQNLCGNEEFRVSITDHYGCTNITIVEICGFSFKEDYLSTQTTLAEIIVPVGSIHETLSFDVFGSEINSVSYSSWDGFNGNGISNPNIELAFNILDERVEIDHSFDFGYHSLEVNSGAFCSGIVNFRLKKCYEEKEIKLTTTQGGIVNSTTPAFIQADLEFTNSLFTPESNGSNLTYALVDAFGRVVDENDDGYFQIFIVGEYFIRLSDACGTIWESSSQKFLTCGDGRIELNIRDVCGDQLGTRTWFQVGSFLAPENSPFQVGDVLSLSLEYSAPDASDDLPFNGDVNIFEIRDWPQDFRLKEYRIADNTNGSSNERFHIKVNNDHPNGILTVNLSSKEGCTFIRQVPFGESFKRLPLVTSPLNSVHTDQTIIAADTSFKGPFWFGHFGCFMCSAESSFGFGLDGGNLELNENDCQKGSNRLNTVALFSQYKPDDPERPCTGGGTIKLKEGLFPIFSTEPAITILPDPFASSFKRGNLCGCLFSPRAISDLQYYGFGRDFAVPLYVEYYCGPIGGTIIKPPIVDTTIVNRLCAESGCPGGECEVVFDNCVADLVCLSTGDVVMENIDILGGEEVDSECWVITSQNAYLDSYSLLVGVPCAIDPCNPLLWSAIQTFNNVPLDTIRRFTATTPIPPCLTTLGCDFDQGDWGQFSSGDETSNKYQVFDTHATESPVFIAKVSPNPIGPNYTLNISATQKISKFQLISMQGKVILRDEKVGQHYDIKIQIPTKIKRGVYILRLTSVNGLTTVEKIII